ncbi:hypothetical protein LEP1GSC125_0638 [Leptospira mayottensis 200901122]|uniref:Uncharacterized protein n=1 Tax=Leptospira mayottensis 200901122 TaxID=1193010 RepID=A0AA87MS15_9LEPT|nr:hypothetical protein [Leptospira mayottensis]EKS01304.1 hypothetical protein LEP1GSC125_0638 [Leptospira mayottensis 200901122]
MFTSHKISSEVADLNQKFLDTFFRKVVSKPELVLIINLVRAGHCQFLCERGHPNL